MMLMSLLDVALLTVILLCAGDVLRQLKPANEPLRAVAFTLVCIGAFGVIVHDLHGEPASGWALSLRLGFAIYALILFRERNLNRRKTDVDATGRHLRRSA